MRIHALNIPFDRLAEPADQDLAALRHRLDGLLDGLPEPAGQASRRVAVYGMSPAGRRIRRDLAENRPHWDVAAYDLRGAAASDAFAVLPVSELASPPPRVVVNCAPPRGVLASTACIEQAAPDADMILWHDPHEYVETAHDAYDLYFEALSPQPAPAAASLAAAVRHSYLAAASRQWREAAAPEGEGSDDLGQTLDRTLSAILRDEADDDQGKVRRLLELADRHPFFTIARDAAACLLVRLDRPAQAVAALAPAVRRYPHCHRTLAKLAELHLLTGDREQARQCAARATPLVSSGSRLRRDYELLAAQPREAVAGKWRARPLRPPLRPRQVALHCAVPVWGEAFVDLFMRVTLRSLFAPGNLPYAAGRHPVRFTIYTDPADVDRIRAYPEWRRLNELADVRLERIDDVLAQSDGPGGNRYDRMSRCQDHALATSGRENRFTFFPLADLLFSSHFLQRGLEWLEAGYDTIFFAGMRYAKERLLREAVPQLSRDDAIIAPAKTLFAHAAKAIHPIYQRKIRGDHAELHPNSYFAADADGNIYQHFFAPTPIFIAPQPAAVSIAATLDADLGYSVTDGGLGNFRYVTDTADFLLLELTSEHADTGERQIPGPCPMAACANWLRHAIDPVNKLLGAHTVILRQADGPGLAPEARRLARQVRSLLL